MGIIDNFWNKREAQKLDLGEGDEVLVDSGDGPFLGNISGVHHGGARGMGYSVAPHKGGGSVLVSSGEIIKKLLAFDTRVEVQIAEGADISRGRIIGYDVEKGMYQVSIDEADGQSFLIAEDRVRVTEMPPTDEPQPAYQPDDRPYAERWREFAGNPPLDPVELERVKQEEGGRRWLGEVIGQKGDE